MSTVIDVVMRCDMRRKRFIASTNYRGEHYEAHGPNEEQASSALCERLWYERPDTEAGADFTVKIVERWAY